MHKYWNLAAQPPSWLRALATAGVRLLPKVVIAARHAAFMERLQHTVAEWEARPADRPQLEAVLAGRLSDRVRCPGWAGVAVGGGSCHQVAGWLRCATPAGDAVSGGQADDLCPDRPLAPSCEVPLALFACPLTACSTT